MLEKEAAKLGRAAARTPDVHAADAFKYGFTTADSFGGSMLAADGIRFFSTVHYKNPDETGTTYSNASAIGITLTEENLEIGLLAAQQQKDARGILANVNPRILLVPLALRKSAMIITGSDKRSDTGDNDINVYKGGALEVVVWPELGTSTSLGSGSNTAWFLLDKEIHEMMFQWRERPFLPEVEFDKKKLVYEYSVYARWEFGLVDWRGIWASKGNSAAYSS